MDDLLAWLRGVLDEIERTANLRWDGVMIDPDRAALARVEAERAILAQYQAVMAESERLPADAEPEDVTAARLALEVVVRSLAYGHRFDISGWRDEWKPEGV